MLSGWTLRYSIAVLYVSSRCFRHRLGCDTQLLVWPKKMITKSLKETTHFCQINFYDLL
ncbi:hypothetical protein HanPSC8_Chr01g0021151 [Helianthus annuus]|nr:hypothetical protein HanPSC8_Chr01g0021151 [Helianthus annuus]